VGGRETLVVDVRVLAATNKDLRAEAGDGRFREDLYFRLAVVPIAVPPLRARPEDVPLLAEHFLERYRLENNLPPRRFSADALQALQALAWPGNVRELHNVVERLAIMARGERIGLGELRSAGILAPPAAASGAAPGGAAGGAGGPQPLPCGEILALGGLVEARRRFEAACIEACLAAAGGNVSQAARLLGIDRTNLHKKIQSYGIVPTKG
jgi:two-component system nitrogen regulation response regulator NtrX